MTYCHNPLLMEGGHSDRRAVGASVIAIGKTPKQQSSQCTDKCIRDAHTPVLRFIHALCRRVHPVHICVLNARPM
ncbi:MAG: hypothetical protein K2K98_08250 [Muribaculaceae bacterium]|nr:hypothetical protein [Muribaculaceae bacterium]